MNFASTHPQTLLIPNFNAKSIFTKKALTVKTTLIASDSTWNSKHRQEGVPALYHLEGVAKLFKKVLIFAMLIGLSQQNLLAQNNYQDVVYLKNGSIIRGVITEIIPNKTIKIESAGNVFVYNMDEVAEIKKEKIPNSDSSIANKKHESFLSGNLNFVIFEGGFYPGLGLSYESMVSDKFSIGGEIGTDVFILPYYKFRTRFYPSGKTFYTELDLGMTLLVVPSISPFIGWKIDIGSPNNWYLDIKLGGDLTLYTGYFLKKISFGFTHGL
jgi:hypothetical protein